MKRGLLALAALLCGAASSALADYVVIVANLSPGGNKVTTIGTGQLGGALGQLGGALGGPPGGALGGALGALGGAPGALGGPPGGAIGGPPGGALGGPPGGFQGGPPGGGFRGGLGALGGPPGAGFQGQPPAQQPKPSTDFDPDKIPPMVVAVVEVERSLNALDTKKLEMGRFIQVRHHVGGPNGSTFLANTAISNVTFLHPDNKPVQRLSKVYQAKLEALEKAKAPSAQILDLAEFALGRGMLPQFKELLDKLAEKDKNDPKLQDYLKAKAAIAKPMTGKDESIAWKQKLVGSRYQIATSAHYALINNDGAHAESRLQHLEDAFQSYYYWFAMRGVHLPMPTERLVAILTGDAKDFRHLHEILDSTPVISDSFYARREAIAVFSSRRLDDGYDRLEKFAAPIWNQGFSREQLLKGKYPEKIAKSNPQDVYEAMTLALLLRVMEQDAEISGTSHGASRQLLYASGFLPRGVSAPEWVQYGFGSFFETAPGSPWTTVGLPSFEHHPVFKDLLSSKKIPDGGELLRLVVTDNYFRAQLSGKDKEAGLRKARATAWSLSHFLIRKRRPQLDAYFKELSQMPRDLALDEKTLFEAFARAFGAVDATGKVNDDAINRIAEDWIKDTVLDHEEPREMKVMQAIRVAFRESVLKQLAPPAPPTNPGPGGPGGPGGRIGGPGGGRPGGGGGGGN